MKTQQNRKSMPASCAACTVLCLAFFGLAVFGTAIIGTAFIGCNMAGAMPGKPQKPADAAFGSISGKVAFAGSANLAGIAVTLEKTDGLLSLAVISAAQDLARGIVPSTRSAAADGSLLTTTDDEGFYSFSNVEPGTYAIYASSPHSAEKAVTTNITLAPGSSLIAPMLSMTAVGDVEGQIILDGQATGNYGFLVCAAGTSFMAATKDDGTFIIYDVPEDDYDFLIIRGNYIEYWAEFPQHIDQGLTNILLPDPKEISSEDLNANPVKRAIDRAIAAAKLLNDGSTAGNALELSLAGTGLDLSDDTNIKYLFNAIEDYYVNLDLSGVTGEVFYYYPLTSTIDKSKILSVTLDAAVKEIGDGQLNMMPSGAFTGFTGLESINAANVTTIGSYAFASCASLSSVNIPKAAGIGSYAFAFCSSLLSVENNDFPLAKNLGSYAFYSCNSLESVSLPAAAGIGDGAFHSCASLASVNIPAAAVIGDSAFCNCASLASVEFLAAESIGDYAFMSCYSLNSVSLPLAANAGVYAFAYCSSLASIELPLANSVSQSLFEGCANLESIDLPAAEALSWAAFDLCGSLSSLKLPKVTDPYAIYSLPMEQLKHVALGIPEIESYSLYNCALLESAEFPEALSVASGAFSNCPSLVSLKMPKVASTANIPKAQLEQLTLGLTSIGYEEFRYCANLISAEFPNAIIIDNYAFANCANLESITVPKAASIGIGAFAQCRSLERVEFPYVTDIDEWAFFDCANLGSVEFPLAETIGDFAFFSCYTLDNVVFPFAVSIGSYTFRSCSSLESIDFPNATSVDSNAFYSCSSLTNVKMPKVNSSASLPKAQLEYLTLGLTSIGDTEFRYCANLISVEFPNAIIIDNYAFANCANLESITVPKAASIGIGAFAQCSSLERVEFPYVTDIDEWAFFDCTNLERAEFPLAETIGDFAFFFCNGLANVDIPMVTNIGSSTFNNCPSLSALVLGITPPSLGSSAFLGSTSDNFTIWRPNASAASYDTWKGNNASNFVNNGDYIVFLDSD